MEVGNIKTGEWFADVNGSHYIKTDPFLRGQYCFQAIGLKNGKPAFAVDNNPALSTLQCWLLDKPDWVR